MNERETPSNQARVEVSPEIIECYGGAWGDVHLATIEGTRVSVMLGENTLWEQIEYPRRLTMWLRYMKKPRYKERVEQAIQRANEFTETLNSS